MKHLIVASILASISTLAAGSDQTDENLSTDMNENRPDLPAIDLADLPIVDMSSGQPVLRTLTDEELEDTRQQLIQKRAEAGPTRDQIFYGDCFNNTGRWAGIYGPHISTRPYDNDLYMVPPGYKSPDNWDCDGFFIPTDVSVRIITTAVTLFQSGPGAVKITDNQFGVLESTSSLQRQISLAYATWFGPGDPVRWYRPGFPQQDLDDLGSTWRPKAPPSK